ncbi:MAG: methyl-accepting chemotaxis protein [Bacteroidetes bacterium]|nr:methyl-accepting chemotaxis protein [Bacteroidota bacterium]
MKWMLNLKTQSKMFLGFGLMLTLIGVIIYFAISTFGAISNSQKVMHEYIFEDVVNMLQVEAGMNKNRALILEMMETKNMVKVNGIKKVIDATTTETSDHIEESLKMHELSNDTEAVRLLKNLIKVRNEYIDTRDLQIKLIQEGKIDEAKSYSLGVQVERNELMKKLAKENQNNANKHFDKLIKSDEDRIVSVDYLFLFLGVLALILSVAITFLMNKMITFPLKEISDVADKIAKGDLTVQFSSLQRRDEVGMLSDSFKLMHENLLGFTKETIEAVNVLSTSASEILASTSQVASGVSESSTAITETTTTVEQVKQTSQVSAQKAKEVTDMASNASGISESGKKSVEETIVFISRIKDQMELIADTIVRLSEQSQSIGEIAATVNDLAEQSNLLAVNASIEAAKAGEQGKGFAVVAQEVKSLAEQSKQASGQVRIILNDVQKTISSAVMATEQGNRAVDSGVIQSKETGESIRLVLDAIMETANSATQILVSTQQQIIGMDQVAQAMENIKEASLQNLAGTKQAETAARSLHEMGIKLKKLVEQYKV